MPLSCEVKCHCVLSHARNSTQTTGKVLELPSSRPQTPYPTKIKQSITSHIQRHADLVLGSGTVWRDGKKVLPSTKMTLRCVRMTSPLSRSGGSRRRRLAWQRFGASATEVLAHTGQLSEPTSSNVNATELSQLQTLFKSSTLNTRKKGDIKIAARTHVHTIRHNSKTSFPTSATQQGDGG